MCANNQCRELVQQQKPFEGSNLFAVKTGNNYIVYSHGHHFPIYACLGGVWFANRDKYSRSTTRHQAQARPFWDGSALLWVGTNDMQRLIQEAA